ncbi:group II intron reverse transcriptase/maturase [Paludibaculum fermentans]|uniref:group II intron reverse transcriptase/maturase n=1 Tax=Paludibaculum fermentans TaxID=1473598 RepID=UPI001E5E5878|nr:group II intron reverse transcriptase/maturase [Paludibaculum fermentans]
MNGDEESDCAVVSMNPSNKATEQQAEAAEREEKRARTKENTDPTNTPPAQDGRGVSQGLAGVRKVAKERKQEQFTTLLHHLTHDLLRTSFYALKKNAAPGVDGVTWQQYEEGLEGRLADLKDRIHRGAYRAQPSRRIYIPKADGRKRPIGIAALEDKIVQQSVVTILNEIYEVDFRGFSYGFRPGRSPHQALDALSVGIRRKKVNWVLDADIRGFFDQMSHEWTIKFIQHRVADTRILRLIQKWLKAGVSEEGEWSETKVGTPQGAVISPLLANVYLHYVFDLWVEAWRKRTAEGDMLVVRYADDLVVGFQHREEVERFLEYFQARLAKFGLELHPEKTRLIEFGRFAQNNRQQCGEGEPESFTFLGFTHQCGRNSLGRFTIWRRTARKRLEAKLQQVKQTLRERMHEPVPKVGEWLGRVLNGFYQYHAVPGNWASLDRFRERIGRYWWRVLKRRSQKARVSAARATRLFERWLPRPRLLHPHPAVRFDARYPR